MDNERKTQETTTTTKVEPSAEERALNRLQLERMQATQGQAIESDVAGYNLLNTLLTGGTLPGNLAGLGLGITDDMATQMAREGIRDIPPQLQSAGLLDSGVGQSIVARTAGDIRRNVAESNLNRQLSLLGLTVGAPAQISAPYLTTGQQLSSRLAGLRSTTGTGTQTITGGNPFLTSFQTALGRSLGGGTFGALKFGAGFGR